MSKLTTIMEEKELVSNPVVYMWNKMKNDDYKQWKDIYRNPHKPPPKYTHNNLFVMFVTHKYNSWGFQNEDKFYELPVVKQLQIIINKLPKNKMLKIFIVVDFDKYYKLGIIYKPENTDVLNKPTRRIYHFKIIYTLLNTVLN